MILEFNEKDSLRTIINTINEMVDKEVIKDFEGFKSIRFIDNKIKIEV